jgi:antitoxin component YwqK of YwqJK toxin-antitoxin module
MQIDIKARNFFGLFIFLLLIAAGVQCSEIVGGVSPTNGVVKVLDQNEGLKGEIPYINSIVESVAKANGVEKIYYENGRIKYEAEYKDYLLEGLERRYMKMEKFACEILF